jgi:hypothetical protein
MGRTKIASFQRKSYKNLQLNARKIPNLSNEIIDFGIVQAELRYAAPRSLDQRRLTTALSVEANHQ